MHQGGLGQSIKGIQGSATAEELGPLVSFFLYSLSAFFGILMFPVSGEAQTGQTTEELTDPNKETKAFRLQTELGSSTSLHDLNHPNRRSSLNFGLRPSYRWNDEQKTRMAFGLDQSLVDKQKLYLRDTYFTHSFVSLQWADTLYFRPHFKFKLPSSRHTRERESLYTSSAIGGSLTLIPPWPDLQASYIYSFWRNFHRYPTSTRGNSNSEYELAQNLYLQYSFFKNLSLSASLSYSTEWTYQDRFENYFVLAQSLDYQWSSQLRLSIGHNNSGSVIAPNGTDYDVSFFDRNQSSFYASIAYTY